MVLQVFENGTLIGRLVPAGRGTVYAYAASGEAVGTFADLDAAASALTRRVAA